LRLLAERTEGEGALAVVFGGDPQPDEDIGPIKVRHVGRVDDERRLNAFYASADLLAAPILEDNLPNVVLESLASGTPVVASAAGGVPDAIDHQINGYLAPVGSARALADGITWVLADPARRLLLRKAARATAEARFDIRACARRYRELFAELIARPVCARVQSSG